jgi:EAL domain-containing protein (putative c-di-GMP-specific phosphodiesterase class I)
MDDFGTGYSSLNMLTEMPFDVLKLDMAFVKNIHTDEKALRLVEFIMDIARYLNVSVIAEGVEYKEQYDLLKKMGCNVIQGYYFSKPLCCDEFENLLKQLQEMCDAY